MLGDKVVGLSNWGKYHQVVSMTCVYLRSRPKNTYCTLKSAVK